jgi:hypothetical protein
VDRALAENTSLAPGQQQLPNALIYSVVMLGRVDGFDQDKGAGE